MSDLKKPDRILFLLTPEQRKPFVVNGVDRSDGGTGTASADSTLNMSDEIGAYIPCSAGGYHVHRGPLAYAEHRHCNCPHHMLRWIAKMHNALMCAECHRTFVVEGGPDDEDDVVCVLENNGVVSVFSPKDGVHW